MKQGRRIAKKARKRRNQRIELYKFMDTFRFIDISVGRFLKFVDSQLLDSGLGKNQIKKEDYLNKLIYEFFPPLLELGEDEIDRVERYYTVNLLNHKKEVFLAGLNILEDLNHMLDSLEVNGSEFLSRLILHDSSKYSFAEYAYATHNFGGENSENQKLAFDSSWHHHKLNNDHHPEHWLSVNRDASINALPMPTICIMEMIADWIGAGKTYGNDIKDWLPNNIDTFVFHPDTRAKLEYLLTELDIPWKAE